MQVGLINSALMISVGSLFCQLSDSTDNIDRVQYLLDDIKEAVLANGAANGFSFGRCLQDNSKPDL